MFDPTSTRQDILAQLFSLARDGRADYFWARMASRGSVCSRYNSTRQVVTPEFPQALGRRIGYTARELYTACTGTTGDKIGRSWAADTYKEASGDLDFSM